MFKPLSTATFALALLGTQSVQALPERDLKLQQSLDGVLSSPNPSGSLSQVTSVSELRDVEPTEWAFEALRSLVERYGCIVGYPDRTYRGDRALTRWEFAAGLNACLNTIERLLQENVAVLREDLDKLKRLAEEFKQELAALGARVDNLEERTAFLEDHQFSTTTTLTGEVVVGLSGFVAGERNEGTEDIPTNTTLSYRTRLELNTSFTGEDLLYTRLATGNTTEYTDIAGTFQANLGFTQPDDNDLAVEVLFYSFPITENIQAWALAAGGAFDDFTNTLSVLDGDGAFGALSAFGTRSPIYYMGDNSGLAFQGNFGDFEWTAGYLAFEGNDPSPGSGLFNGPYGMIAQVGYVPSETFGVALTYVHGYNNLDTGVGSRRSNFQFFTEDLFGEAVSTANNAYGVEFSWQVFEGFVLGGWGGYTKSVTLNTIDLGGLVILERGNLDIWNWAVTLAFPDAFKEGSMAGVIVGMQPWVANSSITFPGGISDTDNDSSFHIEAFYQYAINDNISITPGIIVITNSDYNSLNDTLIIGTIRTTFTF